VFTPGIDDGVLIEVRHCPDPETARESAQRLQQIAAQEDAPLLYGHDAAQWQTLRLSPWFYD
jgi:hypothetical protein